MPKAPSQPSAKLPKLPPYRLVLVKDALIPAFGGILHSPRLDPLMHAGFRAVGIAFDRPIAEEDSVIDSFQINSMTEYLANQASICRDIEAALDEHCVAWSLKNLPSGRAAWKLVRVVTILLVSPPTRGTRTAFTVVLGPRRRHSPLKPKDRPWSGGDDRHCLFRNGLFVGLNIEG